MNADASDGGVILAIVAAIGVYCVAKLVQGYRRQIRTVRAEHSRAQHAARNAKVRAIIAQKESRNADAMERDFLIAVDGLPESITITYRRSLDYFKNLSNELVGRLVDSISSIDDNPDSELPTPRYGMLQKKYAKIADEIRLLEGQYRWLLDDVKEDQDTYSPESLTESAAEIDRYLKALDGVLDTCELVFDVAGYRCQMVDLQQRLLDARQSIGTADPLAIRNTLRELQEQARATDRHYCELVEAQEKIIDACKIVKSEIANRRGRLEGLQYVRADRALHELTVVAAKADETLGQLSPSLSHHVQVAMIEQIVADVNAVGIDAEKEDELEVIRIRAERRREREERERRLSNSYGGGLSA